MFLKSTVYENTITYQIGQKHDDDNCFIKWSINKGCQIISRTILLFGVNKKK